MKQCPGEKMIGVLLPPSVPGALLNFGISLAGRVPVNLNYTSSKQAMEVAVERSGLKTIFTTEKLLSRLGIEKQPGMVMVEDVAKTFTRLDKLVWAVVARLVPTALLRRWLIPRDVKLDSLATVIFSSGSTGMPKGVMLSHRNIVSNLEAVQQTINVNRTDCLLGILPFFHSFGFSIGLWLPAISGFGVAYHTNPLEARKIGEALPEIPRHNYDFYSHLCVGVRAALRCGGFCLAARGDGGRGKDEARTGRCVPREIPY